MTSNAILGWICLIGGCAGVLTNVRMTTRRPNPLLALGGVLFFAGPLIIGLRLIAQNLDEIEAFGFISAAIGLLLILAGLLVRGRRPRRAP